MSRTYYDGRPYYCETCGLGFAEFMACDGGDCKLESEDEARKRHVAPKVKPKRKRVLSSAPEQKT